MKKSENSKAVVRYNRAQGGIELVLTGIQLDDADKAKIHELGIGKWHKRDHYYYGEFTEEKIEAIRKSDFIKSLGATLPPKKADAEVSKTAKVKAEEKAKKKASAPTKRASVDARLTALTEQMASMAQALTALTQAAAQKPAK